MPIALEITLFCLYILLGPLTWAFMILSMFEGRRRMSVLFNAPPLPQAPPPLVVAIPARNEQANIARCLASVLSQHLPGLAVVVADDRSTDDPPAILARLAAAHPNLHLVRCTDADVVPGWSGKNSAMHNAYQ